MNRFEYQRVDQAATAVEAISRSREAKLLAGGTNLIDLMKNSVERPTRLVDINHVRLGRGDWSTGAGPSINRPVARMFESKINVSQATREKSSGDGTEPRQLDIDHP
jgi:hypothetical protein